MSYEIYAKSSKDKMSEAEKAIIKLLTEYFNLNWDKTAKPEYFCFWNYRQLLIVVK